MLGSRNATQRVRTSRVHAIQYNLARDFLTRLRNVQVLYGPACVVRNSGDLFGVDDGMYPGPACLWRLTIRYSM